jgi:hypothetical protein
MVSWFLPRQSCSASYATRETYQDALRWLWLLNRWDDGILSHHREPQARDEEEA